MYDDSSCPESWHYWGISCYMITGTKFTWADAKEECISMGGVLAVPSSDQEHDVIVNLMLENTNVLIDCNDLQVERSWKCGEGNVEVAYRNWRSGEPNNAGEGEDCATMSTSWGTKGQWIDRRRGCGRAERVTLRSLTETGAPENRITGKMKIVWSCLWVWVQISANGLMGVAVIQNWFDGEPDNEGVGEDCAVLDP
ncbi:lactose-binding lectin l-2-like [Asterias rubens]|uniref:lactose-binding lectin l-2-like n=1 Tax=Asterias rubens TaxID=7604 RepID=UPI001455535F|nr:lactose-binding lectin l-2-like [Asterias rubens]